MTSRVETPTEIRPFTVDIPEEELTELRRRIEATRLPSKELVEGWGRARPGKDQGDPRARSARERASLQRDRG